MRDLVRREAEAGTTVFFSSHILSEVEAVCDRVAILADGDLAVAGTIDELRAGTATDVTLELTVESVDDGLARELRSLAGVDRLRIEDRTLQFDLDTAADKARVIEQVGSRTQVTDVIAEAASLESMFERYVSDTDGDSGERDPAALADRQEVPA